MRHHLVVSAYPDAVAAKFVLQSAIAPFGLNALLVPLRLVRCERLLLAPSRIVIDQRYMTKVAAMLIAKCGISMQTDSHEFGS